MKLRFVSAQRLESAHSKSFAVSISCKARPSGVSLEPLGLENISQVPPDRAEVGQSHDARKAFSVSLSVKVKLGYSSAKKLVSARSKSFPLSLSLETKAVRS